MEVWVKQLVHIEMNNIIANMDTHEEGDERGASL